VDAAMFRTQTLFIVGAGASAEFGLPVGRDLAKTIATKMDIRFERGVTPIGQGDLDLYQNVTQQRRDRIDEFQNAGWLIRDGVGLAASIDDFLDQHRMNEVANLYGKAAIVKSILEAERGSRLYFNRFVDSNTDLNVEGLADTWLVKFMHMLGRNVPKENVREIFDPVSFVIFNYDRCIEFFLGHALQKAYGIVEDEAFEIVGDLHIIHPFGDAGNLEQVPFGTTSADYRKLAGAVKTYTEQLGAGDVVTQIRNEVYRAKSIIFLGFAYHSQNMLMFRPDRPEQHKKIFGTAFRMSDADVDVVVHQLAEFFAMSVTQRAQIKIDNKHKSADLFDYYAKSLTGGD
jgi:hypothetical protein